MSHMEMLVNVFVYIFTQTCIGWNIYAVIDYFYLLYAYWGC